MHPPAQRYSMPLINLFRHISPFCWLPLIILMMGIGEIAVGMVMILAMVFSGIITNLEALFNIPKAVKEQGSIDGARRLRLFWNIELPLAMGGMINSFRILWSVGWTTIIAAEMLGVKSGMGYRLLDYRYLLQYRQMLVYIAIIGSIGIITDWVILKFRERYFPIYHT